MHKAPGQGVRLQHGFEILRGILRQRSDRVGRQIIELFMNDAPLEDYLAITPMSLR